MKSAVLIGIGQIEIRDIPKPEIRMDSDVLLKMGAVGLCGSDIHYYKEGGIGEQKVEYPFVVGHECVGIVEQIGQKVESLRPGDLVAVDPAVSCGICDQCRKGRLHTCLDLKFLGCPGQLQGCLSEHIVIPEKNCYRLKKDMTLAQGVLAEPMAIGIYAVDFLLSDLPETIAILGCGPIGLSALLAAREAGISRIYATDKIDNRLLAAKQAGAIWTGNPNHVDVVTGIQAEVSGLEAVLECCGDQEALDQAVELLSPGGKLLILGIPSQDKVGFAIHKLRRKEIDIQNVRRQNHCTQRAVDMIDSLNDRVGSMATHFFALDETQEAFELVSEYRDNIIKAVIQF